MPSAPKFDLKLWRAVLEHLGFTPQQAKKGTEAYDVAMAEYKQHAESGGGVGSSRPAKVAPAPPPPTPRGMPVDVSAQILEITGRIMRDAESLRHAMQDKKTGKAPRARGYRLDDIREEEGGRDSDDREEGQATAVGVAAVREEGDARCEERGFAVAHEGDSGRVAGDEGLG